MKTVSKKTSFSANKFEGNRKHADSSSAEADYSSGNQTQPENGKRFWIFQSKKERFDISDPTLLDAGVEGWWHANQKYSEMQDGDEVFFWLAGDNSYRGIYARGVLTSGAYADETRGKGKLIVNYRCLERFNPYISIEEIKQHKQLESLQILRQPQGSNFLLNEKEAGVLGNIRIQGVNSDAVDPAKLHLDTEVDFDMLGREGFVDALAIWIKRVWHKSNANAGDCKNNSFTIHLHGAWGSGKSTLLKLLEKNLTSNGGNKSSATYKVQDTGDKKWIVIRFSAWQNCHVKPIWWPLLQQVYKDSRAQLIADNGWSDTNAMQLFVYNFRWKLISGNKSIGTIFICFILLLVLLLFYDSVINLENELPYAKTISSLGAGMSAAVYIFRSLVWGSANAAEDYLKLHQDPLRRIKQYFSKIAQLADRPVMIYIDDLDRCDASYVVELLESIQTLFNDSKVFYLVAADRRWIYCSFQKRYESFQKHIAEPGKHIGYLFLEKIFQLSVSVPRVSKEEQESYLRHLYGSADLPRAEQDNFNLARHEAELKFAQADIEHIIGEISELNDADPRTRIWKEEAVRASAREDVEVSTEFFLLRFAHLLEPNPRAMKRLVNNYGVFRAMALLDDIGLIDTEDKRKQFALWNIVKMRWPLLVEYLEEHPELIDDIISREKNSVVDGEIVSLLKRPELTDVLDGEEIGVKVDPVYVKHILKLECFLANASPMRNG